MTFQQKLDAIVEQQNSLLCIGLDSELARIPAHLQNKLNPQFAFNKAIIDATHDLVCAYKPNTA
ncbi:MAG: orotidine 5'-phosphate decarboxylase, partial [Patescibacteria group bacterium]